MIEIWRKVNGIETLVGSIADDNAGYEKALMGVDEVRVSVVVSEPLDIQVRDYIRMDGVEYTLNREPDLTKASAVEYRYDLVFESPAYNLMDKLYREALTGNSRFFLTGTLEDFVDLLLLNINDEEFDSGWGKYTDENGKIRIVETELKNLTFESVSCYDVLSELANEFAVEYRIEGRKIAFEERVENIRDLKFEQGCGNGLYTLKRQNVDSDNTVTRAYVYGSTENLPAGYREGRYDRLVPQDENGVVIPYFENTREYSKVVEKDVFFDDVKPAFTGSVEKPSGENHKVFSCGAIDFDLNEVAIGDQARVNFLTGALMGIGFGFKYNHVRKEITLTEQEDETSVPAPGEEKGVLPNALRRPESGDKFNFTGIILPQAYITDAERRLAEKGRKWMDSYSRLRVKYNLDVDFRYLRKRKEVLEVGDVVRIVVPGGGEQPLRITSLKKQLSTGKLSCEVSNYLTESWEKQIEGKIQENRNSVEINKSEVMYSIQATREWVGRYFARLAEQMQDGQAIAWDEALGVVRTVAQVPDAILWNREAFADWLDQAVRTTDEVQFKRVVAEELIENTDKASSGEAVSMLLVEEGPGEEVVPATLGELANVDPAADTAGEEEVILYRAKGSGQWTLKLLSEIGGGGSGEILRNVRIVNHLDSKNITANKGEPCFLNFTFVSQERYSYSEPYEDTGERGLLQISARSSDNSEYVVVKQMYINSAAPVSVDVAEFLSPGANNIMIKVTGEVTEVTTPAFVYTVQLTSLSVSAGNFRWWTAYQGGITLPLNIGGNISKTLYVTLTGEGYKESWQVPVGTGVYTETAYNHTVPHPGRNGVFRLSAYVANSDGSIKTKTVSFNIICILPGSAVKLAAINNLSDKVTNWTENALFDYAMYDGGNVTTSARFVITQEGQSVFSANEDSIATSAKHTFSLPLEIETPDNSDFVIQAYIQDGETDLIAPLSFQVNNSLGYSAVAGAVLYINPRTRSNRQENYREVRNETDGSFIPAAWEGMNWGNDGWVTDADGNRVLRLLAGSRLTMGCYPFATECARTGKTIEVDYRVDNVTDYSRPVLTISAPSGDSFVGLNIYADEVIMHSQSLKNDSVQSLHTFEGKRTRLTLTILPAAYGNPGFNLCILYINGVKNREFTYEDNDYFAQDGGIIAGSDYADVDIYGIREYNSGLTSQGVLTNYINWLPDTGEKARVRLYNDILDGNGSEVDFENTKDQFNVMVFDNTIPSMADQSSRKGVLEMFFADHPEWNVSVSDVTAKGQGTSSMKYWIWNTRYQLDKNLSVITHADGTTSGKKWQMVPGLPAGQKFTAKKNYASSMQSHKIGSVNSYNDLYREMELQNEAMQTEQYATARVAVYQLPFVCFEKSVNEEGETVYAFRGLYTMGPDKGDKYTFGFDTSLFPGLISIEGADNSPLCTLFRVPWNNNVFYNEDEEAWQYNGANSWDFGEGKLESISRFIPAYNLVYQCSPRLLPFEGTPDELNARVNDFRTRPYEYWIAKAGDPARYDVYYFEASQNRFIPSDTGEGTINLASQLADQGYGLASPDLEDKTPDEQNALFINARIVKFRREAPVYWDIDDTLFFMNNVEFNAGTDERAKNTYPYSFGTETAKFRWRVDDADTRFDTTNRGLPDKEYSVETHDTDETGASVWNGETNNFFNLMELAFPDEKTAGMRKMMTAMQTLGGLRSGNDLEKLYAFYQKYFFDAAQDYFPQNGYNADARYCYENGKLAYISGIYSNDTDPVTQSLGDHYLAEQRWITKRIIYMMSKYSFGLFSANGTDTITVRAAGNTIRYELTPAMDLYPAIANGTSIIRGARTKAGEVCEMEIELSGTGDQQNAIQGASWLMDIGDWHDKNVQGSMIIQGRMLREIRLGSKTEPIVISISSLTISNCISLRKLVLSNIASLSGTLNLISCTHLQEVYADGTSLVQLRLPSGGGLRKVEFSAYNQYLLLSNYPLMTNEGVGIDLCKGIMTDFFVVECPLLNPMRLLVDIMNAQAAQGSEHALKRIRAVGFEETYNSSDMLDKLVALADGSYSGLNSEGLAGDDELPVLEGTLNVQANAYEDSVEALRNIFKKLILNIIGKLYIRFKDSVVKDYFVHVYGDGVGIISDELASIINLNNTVFQNNTEITSFDEFRYLTGVTEIKDKTFRNCSSLKSIVIPQNVVSIGYDAFALTGLENITIPCNVNKLRPVCFSNSTIKSINFENRNSKLIFESSVFRGCSNLTNIIFPDIAEFVNNPTDIMRDCISLQSVHLPESPDITSIPIRMFQGCVSLTDFNISSYITKIDTSAFANCSLIPKLDLSHTNVTYLGDYAFDSCKSISEVIFNPRITYIGIKCFINIAQITSIEFPPLITVISKEVCRQCTSLRHIDIPVGVTRMDSWAFAGCHSLRTVIVRAITPPSFDGVFAFIGKNNFLIYVPDESVVAYKSASGWIEYADIIRPLSEYVES